MIGAEELERVALVDRTSGGTRTGSREAFERLTAARLDRAYRLAGIVLGDPSEARDAVHDAVLRAWRHWRELREPDRFDAWFDRIVVNACRDRSRRRRLAPVSVAGPIDPPGTDASIGTGERDALDRALTDLPAEQRLVLALRFVEDLTVPGIAARIGVPEGTVKSRLHRGLSALRASYDAAERTTEVAR